MRLNLLILLTIIFLVSTVCLLNSCDEECAPCNACPPDPASEFIGLWTIITVYLDGIPTDISPVGDTMDFRSDGTLIQSDGSSADTMKWFATDEFLYMITQTPSGAGVGECEYYFEADTLNFEFMITDVLVRYSLVEEGSISQP